MIACFLNLYQLFSKLTSKPRARCISFLCLWAILFFLHPGGTQAQSGSNFHKHKKQHYRQKFGKKNALRQCIALERKRYRKPKGNKPSFSFSKKERYKPQAEIDPGQKIIPEKTSVVKKTNEEQIPKQSFDEISSKEKHRREDEVLVKNHLPRATSRKQEEIREQVKQKLEKHVEGDPIELAPLYFNFDQDEFSVVDMDPFLVAVEYALQGRIILISGHTDSFGNDSYNVQLSIKRVEKIRKLMHDMGVPDDRISVVGYGEEIAKHDNSSKEGRQLNRRVDFTAF